MIRHFGIEELVPENVFNKFGNSSWWFLDYRTIKTLEWMRDHLGPCTVNNWFWGGKYDQSGFRTSEFYVIENRPEYIAKQMMAESFSQHKYGRAFDCKFKNHTAEEARNYIKNNWELFGLGWAITIEEDVSWLHFDVRNRRDNKVHTFKP